MGLLFTLAIVVAIGAVFWKKLRHGGLRRGDGSVLEYEEDVAPRIITSHDDIDGFMRCTCGGKRIKEGEGPRHASKDGALWRVLTRCGSCGRRRALLFRVAS